MKKLKLLLLLPLMLFGLTSCVPEAGIETFNINKEFTAVHIYGYGCVPSEECTFEVLHNGNHRSTFTVRYEDSLGNVIETSSFALIRGTCLICKGEK